MQTLHQKGQDKIIQQHSDNMKRVHRLQQQKGMTTIKVVIPKFPSHRSSDPFDLVLIRNAGTGEIEFPTKIHRGQHSPIHQLQKPTSFPLQLHQTLMFDP